MTKFVLVYEDYKAADITIRGIFDSREDALEVFKIDRTGIPVGSIGYKIFEVEYFPTKSNDL